MSRGDFGAVHARTLRALPEARLAALGNRTQATAALLAQELGVTEVFSTVEGLLERKGTAALAVATNTETHVPLANAALAARIHVPIEKSFGTNLADVQSLKVASRNSGGVARAGPVCGFHSLAGPFIERVHREGFRSAHFVRPRPAGMIRLFPEEHPSALTMVPDLYVAARMAGSAEPEIPEALDAPNSQGKTDHAWATLRWPDGRVATFHSHWIRPPGGPGDGFDWLEIFDQSYDTRVNTNPQIWTRTQEKMTWPVELEIATARGRPTGMLAEELRSFLAVGHGDPVPAGCRIADVVQVQRSMEQLQDSAWTKRPAKSERHT